MGLRQPVQPLHPRTHIVPRGVEIAEQRALLAEQEAAAQRVMDEANNVPSLTLVKPCTHPEGRFSVRRVVSSPFDDHATEMGQCLDCRQWLKIVSYRTSEAVDITPLTEREMDALAALEDRARRADAWEA